MYSVSIYLYLYYMYSIHKMQILIEICKIIYELSYDSEAIIFYFYNFYEKGIKWKVSKISN